MTDNIRNVLRELESQRPDPATVRADLDTGITRRAKRRRTTAAAGVAVAVAALVAGGVALTTQRTGGAENAQPAAAPTVPVAPAQHTPGLVPITVSDATFPVSLRDSGGKPFAFNMRGNGDKEVTYNPSSRDQAVILQVTKTRIPACSNMSLPGCVEQPTTVAGHPAIALPMGDEPDGLRISWQLASGEWVDVQGMGGSQHTRQAAEKVVNTPITLHPDTVAGLTKPGLELSDIGSGAMFLCPQGSPNTCLRVGYDSMPGPITDVPAGPAGPCKIPDEYKPRKKGEPMHAPGPLTPRRLHDFEPAQQVDGATVRLRSDHCAAMKLIDGKQPILVEGQNEIPGLTTAELLGITASAYTR